MSELLYKPKFTNTDEVVSLTAEISALAEILTIRRDMELNPKLRRKNRIKSIHSSLAIENNSLSLSQVTDVIDGKPVLAPPKDICEVKNAFEAYEKLLSFNPYDIDDLEVAHGILMKDLVKTPGQFRTGAIGVVKGREVVHIAPKADMVSGLIADLLLWAKKSKVHPLIKSCVFHYEFEFIHPFADGNGRMGRMWQTLLLYKWKEIFAWLPIETIIRDNQSEYYAAIGMSNEKGDCTDFVLFMLKVILKTMKKRLSIQNAQESVQDNIQESVQDNKKLKRLLDIIDDKTMSANEIMENLGYSHKQTFRNNYIRPALEQGLIEMTLPDTPTSRNQGYRKKK